MKVSTNKKKKDMETSRKEDRTYAYTPHKNGRYTFKIEIFDCKKHRYVKDGKDLAIGHTPNYRTCIGPLNLEDLKALRKLVRKAIRNYEDNESIQI